MANLTSTVEITGTVNGRKVNVSSTMVMENVYDAGIAQPGDSETAFASVGFGGSTAAMTFTQDCPSFLFSVNRSPNETAAVAIQNASTSAIRYMVLTPGQFVILNEYTNGAGLINMNASATNIALEEVSLLLMARFTDFGFMVRMDHMVAFQALS